MILWLRRWFLGDKSIDNLSQEKTRIFKFDDKFWYQVNAGFFKRNNEFRTAQEVHNIFPDAVLISPVNNSPASLEILESQGF